MIVWDEASEITPRVLRYAARKYVQQQRQQRAKGFGWTNWHVNRGRMSLPPTKSELRRASWRRAH